MTKSATGWKDLTCPFFEMVARNALGPFFAERGFRDNGRTPTGGVVFSKQNIFVEISYESETFPKYSLRILLGVGRDEHDHKWRLAAFPIWFLIPVNRPESKYPFWTFGSETTLGEVLKRACTELLEPYAEPLWVDEAAMFRSVAAFKARTGFGV